MMYNSSSYCCRCSLQHVPRSHYCTKKVTPLESSHGHHLPARATSARAARGRCVGPERAATAPGCRACSAGREHRVGSLIINSRAESTSGSQQQAVLRGGRRQLLTMAHIHRIVRPRCFTESSWLRGPGECGLVCDRFILCTQQLNWCAVGQLSFSCLCHEYCCCGTCYYYEGIRQKGVHPPPKKNIYT